MDWQSDNLLYELALWRTPEIGPARFAAILKQFPRLAEFFSLSVVDLSALGLKETTIRFLKNEALHKAEKDLHWQNHDDKHILVLASSNYPPLLKEISAAPPILFVQGDKECLKDLQLGMVGSRKPSKLGLEIAAKFACELSTYGLVITSGFALGIDGACHEAVLSVNGKTIAVMGTGLDVIYPRRHQHLAKKVLESGAFVSEFPIGTPPRAENFPRRNRIISGLSKGIVVLEAAIKSGSLITAYYAVEQGREVFAVPGSISQPQSKGCHQLIRQGAKLVESVEDILQELRMPQNLLFKQQAIDLSDKKIELAASNVCNKDQSMLLKHLTFAAMPIDSIIARSNLSANQVLSLLLELELAGIVSSVPGGYQLNPSL